MKGLFVALILTVFIFPTASIAAELNAGIVQGLWYSEQIIFEGNTTRIYVALRNNTEFNLTGNVRFMDGEERIGTTEVEALPGRIAEAWVDWSPDYGDHTITATLVNIKLHPAVGSTQTGTADSTLAEDTLFVDRDTDDDGIGNKEDTDDDGDGISDEDENAAGTDPLVFDEPETEEPEETKNDVEKTNTEEETALQNTNNDEGPPEGLEQYTDEGRIDATLSSVTKIVTNTKEKIDTYRDQRDERKEQDSEGNVLENNDNGELGATDATDQNATITRAQTAEKRPGIFVVLWQSLLDLVDVFYTFGLWILSWFLGYPGLVQLTLLVLILMFVYKLARRIGKRPE